MNIPTPNNRDFLYLRDPADISECWINQSSYSFLCDTTDSDIIIACSKINELCNRKFNHQIADYVFYNTAFKTQEYTAFIIPNIPVTSIEDIYLHVSDEFVLISQDYLQAVPDSGLVNVVPYPQTSPPSAYLPMYRGLYDVWFRYDSGFAVNGDLVTDNYPKIPEMVKYATALMVQYMRSLQNNTGTVTEFSTQTYSQKNSKPGENSLLLEIDRMLENYKLNHYA